MQHQNQVLRRVYDGLVATKSLAGNKRPQSQEAGPRKKSPATSDEGGVVRRSGRRRNNSFHDGAYVRLDDTLSLDQCLLYADDDYDEWELTAAAAPQHQAVIPPWRPRPAQPTPSEAKFLQAVQVYPPPAEADASCSSGGDSTAVCERGRAYACGFLELYRATVPRERADFLAGTVAQLDRQLGPHLVQVLGLSMLGSKHAATWQPHEELLFCLGMCDKYRMFKSMKRLFIKSRTVHELNGYYYNVWKTRSTPEADEFLTLREAHASDEEYRRFEQAIRERLAAMWDVATFGDLPVSAAGPAPLRQRPARVLTKLTAQLPLAAAPPGAPSNSTSVPVRKAAGGSPAKASPAAAAAAALTGSTQHAADAHNSSTAVRARAPAGSIDLNDPAMLAAMPAVPTTAAIVPRKGAFVVSTPGRMRLTAGVTHVAAPLQRQQQQQQLTQQAQQQQQPQQQPQQQQQQQQQQSRLPVQQSHQQSQQPQPRQQQPQQQQQQRLFTVLQTPQRMQPGTQQQVPTLLLLVPTAQQQQQQQQLPSPLQAACSTKAAARPHSTAQHAAHAAAPQAVAVSRPAAAASPPVVVHAEPAAAAAAAMLECGEALGPGVSPSLCLPEMPRMPDLPLPDGDDPEALQSWLKALGACRARLSEFKQQVAQQAGEVMQDAHRRIAALQQQRQAVLGCAESHLQALAQREAVLASSLGRDRSREEQQQEGQEQRPHSVQQQMHDSSLADQPVGAAVRLKTEGTGVQQPQHVDDLKAAVQLLLQRPLRKQGLKPGVGSSSLSVAGADGKGFQVVQQLAVQQPAMHAQAPATAN